MIEVLEEDLPPRTIVGVNPEGGRLPRYLGELRVQIQGEDDLGEPAEARHKMMEAVREIFEVIDRHGLQMTGGMEFFTRVDKSETELVSQAIADAGEGAPSESPLAPAARILH